MPGSSQTSEVLEGVGDAISNLGTVVEASNTPGAHVIGHVLDYVGGAIKAEALGMEIGTSEWTGAGIGEITGKVLGGALAVGAVTLVVVAFPEVALAGAVAAASLAGSAAGEALVGGAFIAGMAGLNWLGGEIGGPIGKWLGGLADNAFANPQFCPLVLDLDHDGIELITLDASKVAFDLDGNGFAQHTAWVGPDDGFLAVDTNANGQIDDISELFGGPGTTGFAVLSAYDTNHDSVVNSSDTNFALLRVWQDANQDGLVQSGELTTLAARGITSISLTTTAQNTTQAGSAIGLVSTFTDSTGTAQVADVALLNSLRDTILQDQPNVPFDGDIALMPQLRGLGQVADLHTAALQNADLKAALADIVSNRTSYTSFQDLADDVEGMMIIWAGAESPAWRGAFVDAQHLTALEHFMGQPYGSTTSLPSPEAGRDLEAAWDGLVDQFTLRILVQLAHYDQVSGFVSGINTLVGQLLDDPSLSDTYVHAQVAAALNQLTVDAPSALLGKYFALQYNGATDVVEGGAASAAGDLTAAFDTLLSAPPTSSGGVAAYLQSLGATVREAVALAASVDSPDLHTVGDTFTPFFGANAYIAPEDVKGGTSGGESLAGSSVDDLIIGLQGDDTINGNGGDDTIYYRLGDGNDVISDGRSNDDTIDRLAFGTGITPSMLSFSRSGSALTISFAGQAGSVTLANEDLDQGGGVEQVAFRDGTLWTQTDLFNAYFAQQRAASATTINGFNSGNDSIAGGALAETLSGLNGSDTLAGGGGNDVLNGGGGNDTFIWARGDGADQINESSFSGTTDKLVLQGVNVADVTLARSTPSGNDVTLNIAGTGAGSVKLIANLNETNDQGVDQIVFADGTTWTRNDLRLRLLAQASTSGSDSITGFNTADTITAGTGNDTIDGGAGNDTYIWARGDGADQISESFFSGTADTVILQGVNVADVTLARNSPSGNDVTLNIGGTGAGSVKLVANLNENTDQGVEQIVFADGTTWTRATLRTQLLAQASTTGNDNIVAFNTNDTLTGGAGNDTLQGLSGADSLSGGAGNDTLYGHSPNNGDGMSNTLDGGAGNDYLEGGQAGDVYLFALGHGSDIISEWNQTASGNDDIVRYAAGIAPTDITVSRIGNDLWLSHVNGVDKVKVASFFTFADLRWAIERVEFADGTVWTRDQLTLWTSPQGTPANDTLNGTDGAESMPGGDGNDILNGAGGNDALDGQAGADTLDGGSGNDTLVGGAGLDRLTGGAGADRFVYAQAAEAPVGGTADLITDFVQGSDKIDLSGIDADVTAAGDQAFSWIGAAGFTNVAGQLRYDTTPAGARTLFGDVNGDGVADFQIQVTGTTTFTSSDFIL